MRFVLIFCADNKRDVRLLSLFSLVFGESALRPFRDDDKEEFYEDENEDENARGEKAILEKEEEHESNFNGNASKRTRCG